MYQHMSVVQFGSFLWRVGVKDQTDCRNCWTEEFRNLIICSFSKTEVKA